MKQWHRFSGIYLSVFVTLHLGNHLVALHSIESHILVMRGLRVLYKNPLIEVGLVIAVLVQLVSGGTLLRRAYANKGQRLAASPWKRAQQLAGLYLAFFLLIHVSTTLFNYYIEGMDTNFYFAAMVVQYWPSALFFVPYYGLAVVAYGVHLVCLLRIRWGRVHRARANRRAWWSIGLVVVVAVLILLALLQPLELPTAYRALMENGY